MAMDASFASTTPTQPKPSGRRRHKHKPGNEHLCKYASKACYEHRVAKKTGELHRYCEHHRLQANRNQRRLEQRRRLKDQADPTPHNGSFSSMPNLSYSSDGSGYSSGPEMVTHEPKLVNDDLCSVIFEPYRHPVTLRDEDLSNLRSMFVADPNANASAAAAAAAANMGTYQL